MGQVQCCSQACSNGVWVRSIEAVDGRAGQRAGRASTMSNAALCHVMPEWIDDGKHESAFMKNLDPVDVKAPVLSRRHVHHRRLTQRDPAVS